MKQFSFDIDQWNRLFPFFILLNREMEIVNYGKSLEKICPEARGGIFTDFFTIHRPTIIKPCFSAIKALQNGMFFLNGVNASQTYSINLRGQFEFLDAGNSLIFLGSPWFVKLDEVSEKKLTLNDFAIHDASIDLLHVLETKEIAEKDNQELLAKINSERNQYKHFALITEGTINGGVITDAQGKIIWVNNAFEKITGYTLEEVKGKSPGSMLQGKDTDAKTVAYLATQIKEGKHFECEIINYNKQNQPYWIKISGQPIFDDQGKLIQFFALQEDITELKEVQMLLEKSAKQFRSLSENIPGVVYEYIFRKNGVHGFKFISPTIEKIFGIKAEDFFDFNRYMHPDELEMLMKKIGYSDETNEPFYFEGRMVIAGKNDIWYSASGSFSYQDADGSRIFTGILIDITDKKQTEQRLDLQRQFYELVLNQIPSDIAVFDNKHRYLFLNPIAIKNPELRQWMIGKDDEEYCNYRNKPIAIMEERRAFFNKVMSTKKLLEWEETLIKENGSKEYHLRKMYPVLDEHGEVKMVIGYGINITDRKDIEEQLRINEKRYRDLFNFSQALICTHDLNGNILSVNPSICDLLGYNTEEMIGKPLIEFIPTKERESFARLYLDIVVSEGRSKGVFRVVHKNGKKLFLLFQNYKVEETGVDPYIIGFSQDITERIQAENDLLLAKQITEDVSKAKEIFLANMSHEIRTPMNGILGVANLLAKTELDIKQKNFLKLIKESANNLLVIVNGFLEIEKIASGKIELEQLPYRLDEKIYSAIQSFQYKVEEKGIQIIYHNHLSKDLVVIGDPYRLSQVINNLLNNAIKFTSEGEITVLLEKVSQTEDSILIEISISDTGIGIENDKLDTIFEPFMQASTDTTRKFGGTGLGLSICKSLIEMKGGTIRVESKLHVGTTFKIRLPYALGTLEMIQENENVPQDFTLMGKKRILIAEDVELNQFIASQILESWGMEVAVADNGKIAVEMLQHSAFDLILMDIQMPEMDGIEATKIIRDLTDPIISKIPIIALTANALKGDNHRYFQVGMNDYIIKPYTEENLYAVISKYLTPNSSVNSSVLNKSVKKNAILVSDDIGEISAGVDAEPLLYDLSMVKIIGKGNPIFMKKMVSLFLDQMPIDIQHLREHSNTLDWDEVSKLAHRMKPTIDGMGIVSLKEKIRELESRSRNNTLLIDAEMNALIDSVFNIMEKALNQLKKEFPD